jgi:hypothetical protein
MFPARGTGRKRLKERVLINLSISGDKLMNTLNMIRNQIKKQAALHDAQIAVTSYRGVKYECQQGAEEVHGTFCYRGHTYNK